ncbi:MAG: extracellular solute-binding protein [Anaerolineaceae bacterium]|nr:extracellular solute-binding protein [Anaerolineaceae bacterium]
MKKIKFGLKSFLTRGGLIAVLLVMLVVSACEGLPVEIQLPWINTPVPSKETEPPVEVDFTLTPESPEPEPTQTREATVKELILWLPPELSPFDETPAAQLLQEKLDNFAQEKQVKIVVRVKARTGSGSLIDALTATKPTAPEILPDLIVLSATDLELAVERELVYPHDRMVEMMTDTDWYPFGQELSQVGNEAMAIPLLTNPLSLVYNKASLLPPSDDWLAIQDNFGVFGFAADDSQAKYLLLLYIAAGGDVMDAQGRAILQEGPLVEALTALKEGLSSLHISTLSIGFQTEDQVWNAFATRGLDTAVVTIGLVLNRQAENENQPNAALTKPEITLGTAFGWALGNPDLARQELALDLLAELSETEFLANWSEALGRLPARPSALATWQDQNLLPALESIAHATSLYPSETVMNRLGPALRNATLLILRDGADPVETAKTTIESIK